MWRHQGPSLENISTHRDFCRIEEWEQKGGVMVYAIGVIYMVVGLVLVSRHYFMPSLRALVRRMGLPDDVAGATVFAGGSSAPFVFFGFFSLLAPNSSVPNAAGVVSTVGAGTANAMAVIGIAAAGFMQPEGQKRQVAMWPLARDCGFWLLTIFVLGAVCLDGRLYWWEGASMVALYVIYVALNAFTPAILSAIDDRAVRLALQQAESEEDNETTLPLLNPVTKHRFWARNTTSDSSPTGQGPELPASHTINGSSRNAPQLQPLLQDERNGGISGATNATASTAFDTISDTPAAASIPASDNLPTSGSAETPVAANGIPTALRLPGDGTVIMVPPLPLQPRQPPDASRVAMMANARRCSSFSGCRIQEEPAYAQFWPPAEAVDRLGWALCLPWVVVLGCSIPDCRAERLKGMYLITALVSFAWVGVIAWFLLAWTLKVGCIIHAPLVVMGATALAVNSTMLTAIVCFAMAAQGKPTMVICNAFGSNIFNVLIGLGLPYFVVQAVRGEPALVEKAGLWEDIGTLIASVAVFAIIMAWTRKRLTHNAGYALVVGYVVYIIYIILSAWIWDFYDRA